jgi:hypothetical protein
MSFGEVALIATNPLRLNTIVNPRSQTASCEVNALVVKMRFAGASIQAGSSKLTQSSENSSGLMAGFAKFRH